MFCHDKAGLPLTTVDVMKSKRQTCCYLSVSRSSRWRNRAVIRFTALKPCGHYELDGSLAVYGESVGLGIMPVDGEFAGAKAFYSADCVTVGVFAGFIFDKDTLRIGNVGLEPKNLIPVDVERIISGACYSDALLFFWGEHIKSDTWFTIEFKICVCGLLCRCS